MTKKDIFKIDNWIITLGVIFICLSLLTIFADPETSNDVEIIEFANHDTSSYSRYENYDGRTFEEIEKYYKLKSPLYKVTKVIFPIKRVIIGLSGLILLLFGIIIRKKENKIISIWNILENNDNVFINDLALSLGLTKEFILNNLKNINKNSNVIYIYDSKHSKIVSKNLTSKYNINSKCTNCGNNVNKQIPLHIYNEVKCDYCSTPISQNIIKEARDLALGEQSENIYKKENESNKKNDFNKITFLILLVLCWPGAIVYYIVKNK